MLKLTEHVGIIIFLLYKQKTRLYSDIQNFDFFLNFRLLFAKNHNFQVRHVFMTSKLRNALADCNHFGTMDRGGPYLPIDTKINFIGGLVRRI